MYPVYPVYPAYLEKGQPHVPVTSQPYPEHHPIAESRSTAKWGIPVRNAAEVKRGNDATSDLELSGRHVAAEGHGGANPGVRPALLYTIPEVMALLRLGKTQVFDELRRGRIRSVKVGRARRVPAACLDEFVSLLMREAEEAA